MISRALNATNDIFRVGSSTATVSQGAQVVQAVRSRLLFYRGESQLDQRQGVPYFTDVFVKPANLPLTESLIKTEILRTTGVARLLEFSLDFDRNTRRLSVSYRAETTFGVITGETINAPVRID